MKKRFFILVYVLSLDECLVKSKKNVKHLSRNVECPIELC